MSRTPHDSKGWDEKGRNILRGALHFAMTENSVKFDGMRSCMQYHT